MSTLTAQEKRELVLIDRQLHDTCRCSSCHGARCTSHSTHANDTGDHTKTRFKSENSCGVGFTDLQLGAQPTASPMVSRRGGQLFLTVAGSQGMRVFKADAKTAFLQGSVGDQEVHCEPVDELSQALGLEHHQCVRLRKSVYGLADAPRARWERVEKDKTSQGWRTLTTETCFWVQSSSPGRVYGLETTYVDDFLIVVDASSADGLSALAGVRDWRPWEHCAFTQCGVQIVQSCRHGRWRRFFTVVRPGMLHHWYCWICHQPEETNATSQSLGTCPRFVVCWFAVASTFVVASGMRWSCHGFHNA